MLSFYSQSKVDLVAWVRIHHVRGVRKVRRTIGLQTADCDIMDGPEGEGGRRHER